MASMWLFSSTIWPTIMKLNTEGGTMVNLVAAKQNFKKSSESDSDDKKVLFTFLLETMSNKQIILKLCK